MAYYWIHGDTVVGPEIPNYAPAPPPIQPEVSKVGVAQKTPAKPPQRPKAHPELKNLVSAMVNMGWKRMDAKELAEEVLAEEPPDSTIEHLIRAVLRKVKR